MGAGATLVVTWLATPVPIQQESQMQANNVGAPAPANRAPALSAAQDTAAATGIPIPATAVTGPSVSQVLVVMCVPLGRSRAPQMETARATALCAPITFACHRLPLLCARARVRSAQAAPRRETGAPTARSVPWKVNPRCGATPRRRALTRCAIVSGSGGAMQPATVLTTVDAKLRPNLDALAKLGLPRHHKHQMWI